VEDPGLDRVEHLGDPAAGARVVQYRWSSGYFVFVSTSKRNRRSSWSARPFIDVA
jgi:hypothetical protein